MPLYRYLCPTCGHNHERLCSMADRDKKLICHNCGGLMKRLLTDIVIGKPSHQGRLFDSKGKTVALGKGGSKQGRWYRP